MTGLSPSVSFDFDGGDRFATVVKISPLLLFDLAMAILLCDKRRHMTWDFLAKLPCA
jgi:hypothetical protein